MDPVSTSPLKVIIVGGGVGGLAAAVDFARSGHAVTVYERSTQKGGVGFAFRITANSDRCLKYLGIDTIAGGACAAAGGIQFNENGDVTRRTQENTSAKTGDAVNVFAYRPQLHEQLWDAAIKHGATIEAGVKIAAVDTARSIVSLESGQEVYADLIIGADGVHSKVRAQLFDPATFFPTCRYGQNCFRFMIDTDAAGKDDILGPLYADTNLTITSWTGNGKGAVTYPVDYGKQLNVVCMHPESLSDAKIQKKDDAGAAIDYSQSVSAASAIAIYSEYEPRLRRLMELADPNGFRIWKLLDMDALPSWSRDTTVLLGDACHPVLPSGFSGASMAIEDAVVLSSLLPAGTPKEDIPARLELYEQIRAPRVDRVRDHARLNGVAPGKLSKEVNQAYFDFLTSHNAIEDAKSRLATLLDGTGNP